MIQMQSVSRPAIQPRMYLSKMLNAAEQLNWLTTELEVADVV